MPKIARDGHLTAEAIVAHLDGELSRHADEQVQRHLKECWQCRSRAARMEEQIRSLTEARAGQAYPSPCVVDQARRDFFARFERLVRKETNASVEPPRLAFTAGRRLWRPAAFLAAIAAGVTALVIGPDLLRRSTPPAPSQVLAAVQQFEDNFHESPGIVHQTIGVEIIQVKPELIRRDSELETWSVGQRYASRWRDAGGGLRYAVWRPAAEREFIYHPASAPGVVPAIQEPAARIALVELWRYGLDAESIETGFLEWVRQRQWRPLSFTADFRSFASQEGVVLHVERTQTSSASSAMRVIAERQLDSVLVRLVLEVAPDSYRPRLIGVAFERADRKVEVRLVARRMERLPDVQWLSAVFEPDLPLLKRETVGRSPEPSVMPAPLSTAPQAAPTQAELDSAEVEVRFVLHRLRACLGEPVRVERHTSRIHLSGLAETQERKRQIVAALADVRLGEYVTIDIRVVNEAVPGQPETGTVSPAPSGAPVPGKVIRFSSVRLPIQDRLLAYFRQNTGTESASSQVRDFANSALEISATALEQAWALRRLAERYSPEDVRKLSPKSRWLLEVLVRDHLRDLRQESDAARDLLEPVLTSIIGTGANTFAASTAPRAGEPWNESALALFASVSRMHSLTHALFGGSGLPGQPTDSAFREPQVRAASVEESLRKLQAALPSVYAEVCGAEKRVASEFSDLANLAAGRATPQER